MAVLTISRDLGSGGREVALMLSSSLGYKFVDRERILARLKAAGHKWEKWTEGLDEHTPRVWEKYDWSYRGFVAMVQSEIIERGRLQQCDHHGARGQLPAERGPICAARPHYGAL